MDEVGGEVAQQGGVVGSVWKKRGAHPLHPPPRAPSPGRGSCLSGPVGA